MIHHNVCSISKNFDQVHARLTELETDLDFLGTSKSLISRTSFSPTNSGLANYATEQTHTQSKCRGSSLPCTLIENIHTKFEKTLAKLYKPHKIKSVFVELIVPKRTNVIL